MKARSSSVEISAIDQMIEGSPIREHVMLKRSLFGSLQRVGFSYIYWCCCVTLPWWWPCGSSDTGKSKNLLISNELIIVVEEIEEDAILTNTLEEYETKEPSCNSYVLCALDK